MTYFPFGQPAGLPFEPKMALVPAGRFLMGSEPGQDLATTARERPQHSLTLPDYFLAQTPVTNAQYATFVQDTGHDAPFGWQGGRPVEGTEDHPVVNVSLFDAVEYCRWLSGVTGKDYRVPTEAEWEKGARGTDGRVYPWGNAWSPGRCNTTESGKHGITPVGTYPRGASPYGLLDMAGNVEEWTRSVHMGYPYDPADGREDPALRITYYTTRGGAYCHYAAAARCASRSWSEPDDYERWLGFRCALHV